MSYQVWLAYMLACWMISISPGAGAIASMSSGLNYGFRHGYWNALGLQLALATNRDCRDWGWGIVCHKPLGFYVSEMVWCVVFAVFGFFTVDSADAISEYSNRATE